MRPAERRWSSSCRARWPAIAMVSYALWFGGIVSESAGCSSPQCPKGAVLVPAGTFEMGTNVAIWPAWQLQPRQVTLTRPFCIDQTEAIQRAYVACQDAGKCYRSPTSLPMSKELYDQPKDFVDWEEAVTFCRWRGGRLPTEAEWEFAARGTDGRLYPWGNEPPTRERWQGVYKLGGKEVVNVGMYPKGRSFFGLDDMSGNVTEWVADVCGIHDTKPDTDPTGPDVPYTDHPCHILRGAAWSAIRVEHAAATYRAFGSIGGGNQEGFRCAYDPR